MTQFSFRGKIRGHGRSLRRRIRLSEWALWAERLAVALWPAFSVVCLFLALALIGVFSVVDTHVRLVLQILFGGGLIAALAYGFWRFRRPAKHEAMNRLDRDSPVRPLAAMSDRLASVRSAPTEAIWKAHQRRAEQAALALRAAPPDLRLSRRDSWAFRLFAPALLVAAILGADAGWWNRIGTAFQPAQIDPLVAPAISRNPVVEAWASPPAYTGFETAYLTAQAEGERLSLPEGSEITIRVTDMSELPRLDAGGLTGLAAFAELGGGLSEVVAELEGSGAIRVFNGDELMAQWQVDMIPDQVPEIATTSRPRATLTRALEIEFQASDDYGVVAAWAEIQPTAEMQGKGLVLEPISFALPLPITRDAKTVADSIIEDFTEHPWAGSLVELVLYAEDGAGQVGQTDGVTLRLPARQFNDPLARAIVEQRRDLALDFGQAIRVLDVTQAIMKRPRALFKDRHGPYLGMRMAIRRLATAIASETVPDAAPELVDLLWDIALSLEDGNMTDALERLRDAEQALRDALESGTDEDIARAIDELRQAMNEYLQELARQAEQNPQAQQQQGQQSGEQMSQQDLEQMLNELQRQAESGLRDQARDMLSELSRMLENLQAGQPQMQQGNQGQQALQELQEMIQRQRDLADRTFDELRQQRREQQGQQGQGNRNEQGQRPGQGGRGQGQGPGQGNEPGERGQGGLAQQQEELRRALEELARSLPGGEGASRALGEAGEAMGSARDSLEEGQNSGAVQDQMDALDRMNEGAQALADQMQNGQGDVGADGQGNRDGETRDRAETDPFDRPLGAYGSTNGNQTKVPDRSALDRAREILDELRRRSAESYRPEVELDYFDRLLDQF
ncbi:MAG: TIGR02302 family protein [Pseudomonadota bacterium]